MALSLSSYLGNILENLNRADILEELSPIVKGAYVSITCPNCQKNEAYISKNGFYIYCNRKNKCNYSENLISYIMRRDSNSYDETIHYLANIAKVLLPQLTEEEKRELQQQKEKENLLKDILKLARQNLFSQDNPVLKYLLNTRKYLSDEVLNIKFGALPDIAELENALLKLNHASSLVHSVLNSFNRLNPLLIPIFNHTGLLEGFITRAIGEHTPKYLYPNNYKRDSHFFNINASKNEEQIIIVEGVLDALILSERGIKGVVACGGNFVLEGQLNNLLSYKKVKTIILCLDADDAGIEGTIKSIELLREINRKSHKLEINIYIAQIDIKYKDPDGLILAKGIESFEKILMEAQSWYKWKANYILVMNDITNDIGKEKALSELVNLGTLVNSMESDYIEFLVKEEFGLSDKTIKQLFLDHHEKKEKLKQELLIQQFIKDVNQLKRNEEYDKLEMLIKETSSNILQTKTSHIIVPYSSDKAISDIKQRHKGLNTGYKNLDRYISIPNGAMTIIAGRPSHGKTTFLLNLLINMVKDNPEKSFYFFSYEESKVALFVKIITLLSEFVVNDESMDRNSQQIEYYIKGEHNKHFPINNALSTYENYVNQGRLFLIDNHLDVELLASTIQNQKLNNNVGAVFIDYAQRVKYKGKYESERMKVGKISEILRENATDMDIPFIVGAQLNRENAKQKPQLDNLKEAGHLEEDANIVLGVYNWKTALDKEQAEDANKHSTNVRSIDLDVHVLKNRNGSINEIANLTFDAPILKIKDKEFKR